MALDTAMQRQPAKASKAPTPPRADILTICLAIFFVLAMLGPLSTISDLPLLGEESSFRQVSYIILVLVTLVAIRPDAEVGRLLSVPMPVMLALGWCWLSIAWAISPMTAFMHVALNSIVIWTLFTGIRYAGYERAVLILRMIVIVFILINFASVLISPDFAIHQFNEPDDKSLVGDWRGVMMHKNILGAFAASAVILFAFDADRFPMFLRVGVMAAAAILLMTSGSKTSFGMTIGALVIGFTFLRYEVKYRPIALGIIGTISIIAVLVAYVYADPLRMNLTDPTSFTGRPLIWRAVGQFWLDHPFTGAGYGSFWGIGGDSPIYHYATGWVTQIFSTHNGFLALLAEIGLPGLLLVLYATLVWPLTRLLGSKAIEGPRSALLVALLFFGIGHNATETSLFDRDSMVNVMVMFVVATIAWGGRARPAQSFSYSVSRNLL